MSPERERRRELVRQRVALRCVKEQLRVPGCRQRERGAATAWWNCQGVCSWQSAPAMSHG